MPPESPKTYPIGVVAFGRAAPPFPSDPIHAPEAVGVMAENVAWFQILFRTNQNFLFRFSREQLAKLHDAIGQVLKETASETH